MEQKIQKWNKWLQVLRQEITKLIQSNYIYAETREIVIANPDINNSNIFYDWLTRNYVCTTLMGIRRQLDEHSDSISLVKFLRDLQINNTLLTRKRHLTLYSKDMQSLGNNIFNKLAGESSNLFPKESIEFDLHRLEKIKDVHSRLIDRRIAHYEKIAKVPSDGTFQDLNNDIAIFEEIFKNYFLLLTANDIELLPVLQYDWLFIFKQSWLPANNKELSKDD
ncbi:MAG: hypothetical protein KME12_11135 [Trichocoleus desertorum ATA4-8-CV12]|jgi:hypothetical protein|nr:hypothetical protein [Trichocoleus desertorum ATA4-8-CV12]